MADKKKEFEKGKAKFMKVYKEEEKKEPEKKEKEEKKEE